VKEQRDTYSSMVSKVKLQDYRTITNFSNYTISAIWRVSYIIQSIKTLKTKTCYDHALQKLKSFHQIVVGQKQNQFRSDNPVQKLHSFHQKATQNKK
jgi:hypothetical protein